MSSRASKRKKWRALQGCHVVSAADDSAAKEGLAVHRLEAVRMGYELVETHQEQVPGVVLTFSRIRAPGLS